MASFRPMTERRAYLVALGSLIFACGGTPATAATPNATTTQSQANAQTIPRNQQHSQQNNQQNNNPTGIQITGQLGRLTAEQLSTVLSPANERFFQCYSQRLAERPYLSGRVELKLRIGEDGVPRWAIPLGNTLGDRPTEQCIINHAMSLRFARPEGGETETVYPITLEGGDDARPAIEWPSSRIESVVAQHRGAIGSCTAGISGSIQLTVYAAPRGAVATAGIGLPGPEAARTVECILRDVQSWRLPNPGSWYAKATVNL